MQLVVISQTYDHARRQWSTPESCDEIASFGGEDLELARDRAVVEFRNRSGELTAQWRERAEVFPWLERIIVVPRHLDFYGPGRHELEWLDVRFACTVGIE